MPYEPTITLGPYSSSEIPPPLVVTFKDENNVNIDFSVGGPWVARFQYQRHLTSAGYAYGADPAGADPAVVTNTATVNTAPNNGQVTYTWVAADFTTAGDYEGEMWVGNGGTNRYASIKYAWHVRKALAAVAI